MTMGRRTIVQEHMFQPLVRGEGHRFYQALDKLLREADFDRRVEDLCEPHYAAAQRAGRPSIPPSLFFRMMLVGYFEGISSERGIVWRCADSLSLRDFLLLSNATPVPDQTMVSRTRRRLPHSVFEEVFQLVLGIVEEKGLLRGRVRGVDSTYLKADASMKSIVRKDSGEGYRGYIQRLAAEEKAEVAENDVDNGAEDKSAAVEPDTSAAAAEDDGETTKSSSSSAKVSSSDAVRFDRKRKKTTSNKDWSSPIDPDARIIRMKNGSIRLGYKPEHVVDLDTGVILAIDVHTATHGPFSIAWPWLSVMWPVWGAASTTATLPARAGIAFRRHWWSPTKDTTRLKL